MTDFETTRDAVAKELMAATKGFLPSQEEGPFWTEIGGLFATEKLRYDAATTAEEKSKIAQNLLIIQRTIEMRLARKKLLVRNTIESIVKIVMKTVINTFFPGAGTLIA